MRDYVLSKSCIFSPTLSTMHGCITYSSYSCLSACMAFFLLHNNTALILITASSAWSTLFTEKSGWEGSEEPGTWNKDFLPQLECQKSTSCGGLHQWGACGYCTDHGTHWYDSVYCVRSNLIHWPLKWLEILCSVELLPQVAIKRMFWGKIEEGIKTSSHRESNSGHLAWLVYPVLCHWAATTEQPPQFSICTAQVSLKWLSHTPRRHYVCAVNQNPAKRWLENSLHQETPCLAAQPRCPGFNSRQLLAFSLASIFTSKQTNHTQFCNEDGKIWSIFCIVTHMWPHAWIPPPIPAHAEAERPEEKGKGQVCRRAWTRYGRTNQRVVPAAGQKDFSTRIWWVMHAAMITSMYHNSVNNSGKHCSEPPSLVPRHQIFRVCPVAL